MWLFATCHWSQSGLSLNEKSEQYFISKGYFIVIIVILMKVHEVGLNNSFKQLQTHALSMGPTRFITIYNNEKKSSFHEWNDSQCFLFKAAYPFIWLLNVQNKNDCVLLKLKQAVWGCSTLSVVSRSSGMILNWTFFFYCPCEHFYRTRVL